MSTLRITDLAVKKILTSYGTETIQVALTLNNNISAVASVPAGISAGKYEAKTVSADQAKKEVESLANDLLENDYSQESLDELLVSQNLAGNSTLAVSAAFWKAENVIGQNRTDSHFPQLLLLLFEGGKHGNPNLTFQEFMIIEDSLNQAATDFRSLRKHLEDQNIETTVGAEGGFSPENFTNETALETIAKVFPNKKIALDVAGSFTLSKVEGFTQGTADYDTLLTKYNISSLEDPFSDEDWEKWANFYATHQDKILIVGDDLTVTNPERINLAVSKNAINAVIIKPNQNGTISGTQKAIAAAKKNGLKIIVSHRAQETQDDWIADFALSVEADYVKFGAMDRGERIAKYNRLQNLGMG